MKKISITARLRVARTDLGIVISMRFKDRAASAECVIKKRVMSEYEVFLVVFFSAVSRCINQSQNCPVIGMFDLLNSRLVVSLFSHCWRIIATAVPLCS